jgi:hypothetical protein
MSSAVDYTPVLLAQLTDLQMRVTKQDATIAALKAEVERLTGNTLTVPDTMRTSVPLRSHESGDVRRNQMRGPRPATNGRPPFDRPSQANGVRGRPKVAPTGDKPVRPTMSLSDVLKENEQVTIVVHTGKGADGEFIDTTAIASFDGTNLNVTECEEVKSLVGMKSAKPGEILYKFIDELKKSGVIQKTFTIAPWKLCFVTRNGTRSSLEELRNIQG